MMAVGRRPGRVGLLEITCLAIALGVSPGPSADLPPIEGPAFDLFYAGRKLSDWLKLLMSSDPDLRLGAARSLGDLGPDAKPAVPWLIHALDGRDPDVRFAAAYALGEVGPDAASSIPAMVRALRTVDGFTKGIVGPSLAKFGKASIPSLVELTRDDDYRVRYEAVRALRLLGPLAKGTKGRLVEMLAETEHGIREEAAYALWKLDADRRWLDILIRSLEDPQDFAQVTSASFLALIGPEAEPAIPTLIRILSDPSDFAKGRATNVLGAIGPRAVVAVPAMLRCASRPNKGYLIRDHLVRIGPAAVDALIVGLDDPAVSETVASALGSLGKPSSVALPRLRERMRDAPAQERVAIAHAIWRIDGDLSVVPVLTAVLLEDDFIPRAWAFTALEEIGPPAKGAIPTLIERLGHQNQFAREGASKVLGAIGPEASDAVAALEKTLNDPVTSNRIEAAKALWRIARSEAALKALAAESRRIDDSGHVFAVLALGEIGPDAGLAVPALIEALEDESIFSKGLAAQALGKIGPAAKVAVPRLVEIHNDLHNIARASFAEAILALDPVAAAKAGVRSHSIRGPSPR